jgi:hypothetical protein
MVNFMWQVTVSKEMSSREIPLTGSYSDKTSMDRAGTAPIDSKHDITMSLIISSFIRIKMIEIDETSAESNSVGRMVTDLWMFID